MPNFGTDPASTSHDGRRSVNGSIVSGGVFGAGAGTLDSVSVFGDEDGGGFNKLRVAVYQGGASDTDPAGATLIWDSGELTIPPGAATWHTFNAGGQALAANTRTWVAIRTGDQFHPHYPISADFDDATYGTYQWSQNNSATAYESTVPAITQDSSSPAFKWYLTFSAGGAGNASGAGVTDAATGPAGTASGFSQFTITETLIDRDGFPIANASGIEVLIWRSSWPGAAPADQVITGETTDANGVLSFTGNKGSLNPGDPVFFLFKMGTPPTAWSAGLIVPTQYS